MAENEKQGPIRQTLFDSLRKDGHWKCFCLTALIIGCLVAITWCHLTIVHKKILTYMEVSYTNTDRLGPCKEGYIYIPVAFVIMLYLVYLVECWHSHSRLELRYKCDIGTVYNTIHQMQTALPVIWWKATCYHYVRRTRHVLRYRNGDAFTSTQVYYERVDSKTAGAAYSYSQCGVKDISRPLTDLEKYPAIKIKVSKGFSFANLETEFDFEDQRSRFFQEYETRDDYMEGREGMDLINVDFKEYMIAFRDPDRLPWYVSHSVFWLASLALLSWPLRTIIEYKTAHLHYHIHKLFGSNYLDPESCPHPQGPMSRVSTMNSVELEMSIRNNNVIVPSYSEAVLADAQLRRDYGAIKKATAAAKFPRSLTNVTLAARSSLSSSSSSAAVRPLVPTVTMNQVKKFKSCSAFGKSSSTESALNSGTVRHQLQQLFRERHRLQSKISRTSSSSISGISIANGNVRFNVGTPVSPDDSTAMSHSFSCHSVASARGVCQAPGDDCSAMACETSTLPSRSNCPMNDSQNMAKAIKCSKYQSLTFGSIIRSRSVPGPARGAQSLVNSTHPTPIDSPTEDITFSDVGPCPFPSQPVPIPEAQMTRQDTVPVTEPPSPPSYDVAIRMKRITSPCRAQLIAAVPEIPPNTHAEIGLADFSPSSRARREIYVTGSRVFHDRKQSADSISGMQPAGLSIDNDLSEVSVLAAGGNYPNSVLDTGNVSQFPPATQDHHRNSSQCSPSQRVSHHHPQQQQQQQQPSPKPPLPPLKSLPKVCIPHIPSESEDSDSECIHSAVSELGSLENVSLDEEQARARTPQSQCHAAAADLRLEPVTLLTRTRERDTPSTSVASAAVALVHSQRRHHGGRHKETPV